MTDTMNASPGHARSGDRGEPSLGRRFLAVLTGSRPRPPLPAADPQPGEQHHASSPKHRKPGSGEEAATNAGRAR
jgi:hypothetical protein